MAGYARKRAAGIRTERFSENKVVGGEETDRNKPAGEFPYRVPTLPHPCEEKGQNRRKAGRQGFRRHRPVIVRQKTGGLPPFYAGFRFQSKARPRSGPTAGSRQGPALSNPGKRSPLFRSGRKRQHKRPYYRPASYPSSLDEAISFIRPASNVPAGTYSIPQSRSIDRRGKASKSSFESFRTARYRKNNVSCPSSLPNGASSSSSE